MSRAWLAAILAALCAFTARAQELPSQIRLVVPLVAGSSLDARCRVIADALGKQLGRRVIVENRPGAGGSIGTAFVAKSKPDGGILLMTNNSHVIAPHIYPDPGYDPMRDFTPVLQAYTSGMVFLVHPEVPAASLAELAALARHAPLSYGSSGTGSLPHLAMEMLLSSAGIRVTHVPYRGDAQAMTDLLGGRIHMMISGYPSAIPQVRAGKLRALAITGRTRSPAFPGVASASETYPDYDMDAWGGFFAPARTPAPVVAQLNKALAAAIATAAVQRHYQATAAQTSTRTHAQFVQFVRQESQRYGQTVRTLGLKPE